MRDNLYLPLKKFSLRYAYFMFFDVKPYFADQLFIRRKVRVWFDGEYVKADYPYTMVLCHVRKKDVPAFLEALEDLKRSMIICGYNDYEAEASAFLDNLERLKEEELHGKNDPAGKAIQGQPA